MGHRPGSVLVSYGLLPGDMNLDGVVNTADVAPFVQLLVAGSATQSVPEPGTLALLGGLALLRRGRA